MKTQWTGHEKIKAGTAIGVITAIVLSFVFSIINTQNFDPRSRAQEDVYNPTETPIPPIWTLTPSPSIPLLITVTPACRYCTTNGPCGKNGTLLCEPILNSYRCVEDLCYAGTFDYDSCSQYGDRCHRYCEPSLTRCTTYGAWTSCMGFCDISPTPTPNPQNPANWPSYCHQFGYDECLKVKNRKYCVWYQCKDFSRCGSKKVTECAVAS